MNLFKKEQKNEKDVGFIDDAMFYIQQCIHTTEHAIQSYCMTKDERWIDIIKESRRERSKFLYDLLSDQPTKDERYCFIKHTLSCAQSLKELGHRYIDMDDIESAKECFEKASLHEKIAKLLISKKL